MSDIELLARQEALQAEAAQVLDDLDLFALLETVGAATQTGSSALGLMVARDIDVTTVCPSIEAAGPIFDLGRRLADHPRIRRLTFRNDSGHWRTEPQYPDGLYWMVEYATDAGVEWKLDLWFLLEGTTQFDLEHMQTLPARLDRAARVAILLIKEAVRDDPSLPKGPSYGIYEAVLDHGVRTPAEYARYVARQAPSNST